MIGLQHAAFGAVLGCPEGYAFGICNEAQFDPLVGESGLRIGEAAGLDHEILSEGIHSVV